MYSEIHYIKHNPDERFIALQPWYAKLKKAKTGYERGQSLPAHDCPIRSNYKLTNIGQTARTPLEADEWNKIIQSAGQQADVITTLSALPLAIKCCDNLLSSCAAVAQQGLHTDEIDRDWIYDTGFSHRRIAWHSLTVSEKRNLYTVSPIKFMTAAATIVCDKAVVCNVPYLGKRQVYVLKDTPAVIGVWSEV